MNSHLHLRRSLGLALSALALASAPAPAMPVDRSAGLTAEEQQVLASRGVGPITSAVNGAALATADDDRPKGPGKSRQLERLRLTERTRLQALVDADVGVAGHLIARDFELINPLGEVLTRDALLGGVGSGAVDFLSSSVTSQIRVRRHGNTAVLRYRHTIDIRVAGIGHLTHPAWTTALYERHTGRWQIVLEQTGAIGPLPLPS